MTGGSKDAKAIDWASRAAEELARVMGIMIALLTAIWFFGAPAAEKFVTQIIDNKHLAPQADIINLNEQIKEMRQDETSLSKNMEHLNAQVDDIAKLATEQRQLSTEILLAIKKP